MCSKDSEKLLEKYSGKSSNRQKRISGPYEGDVKYFWTSIISQNKISYSDQRKNGQKSQLSNRRFISRAAAKY